MADTLKIRIDLEGDSKRMFEEIKDNYNIRTNTEAFRLIIKLAHDQVFEK